MLDPVLDQVLELFHLDFDNYFVDLTLLRTSGLFRKVLRQVAFFKLFER